MVGIHQDIRPALSPCQVFGGEQEFPAHSLSLEFGQDVQRELGEVQVVCQRKGDIDGTYDLAVDLGHQDDLAFVGILKFQEFLQWRVGQVITSPGLHPDLASHLDGGQEVRCVRRIQRIRDPQLLDLHVFCHKGHHPSRFCHSPS